MNEVYEDEDGWYYLDEDGDPIGPFDTQLDAEANWSKYFASKGSCRSCRED